MFWLIFQYLESNRRIQLSKPLRYFDLCKAFRFLCVRINENRSQPETHLVKYLWFWYNLNCKHMVSSKYLHVGIWSKSSLCIECSFTVNVLSSIVAQTKKKHTDEQTYNALLTTWWVPNLVDLSSSLRRGQTSISLPLRDEARTAYRLGRFSHGARVSPRAGTSAGSSSLHGTPHSTDSTTRGEIPRLAGSPQGTPGAPHLPAAARRPPPAAAALGTPQPAPLPVCEEDDAACPAATRWLVTTRWRRTKERCDWLRARAWQGSTVATCGSGGGAPWLWMAGLSEKEVSPC